MKILRNDPEYEDQKKIWPKDKAHFDYENLFYRIIEEREKRIKMRKKYGIVDNIDDNAGLVTLMHIANKEIISKYEEEFIIKKFKGLRQVGEDKS